MIDAAASRFGGLAQAAVHSARVLAARADVDGLCVVAERGSIVARELSGLPGCELVTIPAPGRLRLVTRMVWEAARLPQLVRRTHADVLVSFSGIVPRRPPCRVVSMLGNTVPFERPGLGGALRRAGFAATARHASHIVVPSRSMADLVSVRGYPPPVVVAYFGVDHALFKPAPVPGEDIVLISDYYRHKRHDIAIALWSRLREPRPRLRMFGDPSVDPGRHAEIAALARAADVAGRIEVNGRVPQAALLPVYRGARLALMPSENESFGIPVAEALACGVPAIVRRHPTLGEVVGDAGVQVEADDPDGWAEAVQALLDDDAEHSRLRAAGVGRAQRYTWDAFAAALIAEPPETA